jgi:peptide/nickel transport system permease protein
MLLITKSQQEKYTQDLAQIARRKSQWGDVVQRFLKNKLGMLGFIIISVLVILVVFAPILARQDYAFQDFGSRFAYPSGQHILGADNYGRDIWSRLLYGGRISLLVSLCAVAMSASAGGLLGAMAGYFGGKIDLAITRLLDILMAIPQLLLAVAISAALGSGPFNTALAIAISGIPHSMRIMRATVLSIKTNDFIEAARATGSRHFRLIIRHVIPNTVAPLIINSTLLIGGNIMAISSLSFIGLGVQPPTPEWGSILAAGRQFLRDFWPIIIFPSVFIFLTVFGINLLGDGLRDALDPRLKN